jgi:fucose 4-O-acetylase-like acetyltransferase
MNLNNRIDWIDCCKGFALLLVILGHNISLQYQFERFLTQLIYSFHMPLFFILSCITFKFSPDIKAFIKRTFKSFKHLIFPAVMIYVLSILYLFCDNSASQRIDWKYQIDRFIYASGCRFEIRPCLGMTWFLFVLFFGRTILDLLQIYLKKKSLIFVVFLCCLVGILLQNCWYFFSIDVTLAMMPFFYFGYILKKWDINYKTAPTLFTSLLGFIYFFIITNEQIFFIPCRSYPQIPLCYLLGILGTLSLCCLFQILLKSNKMTLLLYLGRNALTLFMIHALDYTYSPLYNITANNIINGICRIIIDISVLLLLRWCKIFVQSFSLSKSDNL